MRPAARQSYIFSEYSSPFPLLSHLSQALHPDVLSSINSEQLATALSLSNLATFVWVISHPDESGELLQALDVPETPQAKGKGRARDEVDVEVLSGVRRRNDMLVRAWKRFWDVVMPREKRSNESALKLWLDLATRVSVS